MNICEIDECDKVPRHGKICVGHLKQISDGRPITSLRPQRKKGSTSERNEKGEKFCPKCECWLPVSFFGEHLNKPDGLRFSCKKCHALQKYGLNSRTYEELFQLQQGKCAVCDEGLDGRKVCIDHDHSCCPSFKSCGKCIRGILCYSCNTADGLLKSDPDIIRRLLKYIENKK